MGMIPTGSSQSRSRSTMTTLAEINVTPLVDVMLVLLIVFMISAPLMQHGMQVDVPKANTGTIDDSDKPITLVIQKNRTIEINGNPIQPGRLREKLQAISQARKDLRVYVQADQNISYGYLAQVIAEVRQSGLTQVGLVTEPADTAPKL